MSKYLLNLPGFLLLLSFYAAPAQENRSLMGQSSFNERTTLVTSKFEMEQNSPNPFTTSTLIEFSTPVQGFVEFKIVNLIGKEVYQRVMEAEAGRNNIRVESDDFIPGVYVYSLSNGSQTITRRMVISKK